MNRKLISAILLVLPLCADSINFDDQSTAGGAVQLSNQYAGQGVIFNNIYAAQNFKFNIVPPSAPNYASPFWVDLNPGYISFVDPTNAGTNATVSSVTFTLVGLSTPVGHPGNFSGATVDALDLFGNVIAGQSFVIPATAVSTADQNFTFTGNIHQLRFTHTDLTTGTLPIDDLTFSGLATPEPSTITLLGGGLLLLGFSRRKH